MRIYAEQVRGKHIATHAVVIWGHGRENGIEYYLILNSWGDTWGEQGFGRIDRRLFHLFASPGIPYQSKPEDRQLNSMRAKQNVSDVL